MADISQELKSIDDALAAINGTKDPEEFSELKNTLIELHDKLSSNDFADADPREVKLLNSTVNEITNNITKSGESEVVYPLKTAGEEYATVADLIRLRADMNAALNNGSGGSAILRSGSGGDFDSVGDYATVGDLNALRGDMNSGLSLKANQSDFDYIVGNGFQGWTITDYIIRLREDWNTYAATMVSRTEVEDIVDEEVTTVSKHIVEVSQTQPSSPYNAIWVKPDATGIQIPTMDDFNTYKDEVDGEIEEIESSVDEAQRDISDLKGALNKVSNETGAFPTIVGFRFLAGDIDSTGALVTSTTKMRTNGPVRLLKGDKIRVLTSGFKFGLRKYQSHDVSSYDSVERSGDSADYTIVNTGYYIPVAWYSDDRTLTTNDRKVLNNNIVIERKVPDDVLLNRKNDNILADAYIFPYAGNGRDDWTNVGVNNNANRIQTIVFRVEKGTKIVFSQSTIKHGYSYYNSLDMRDGISGTGWETGNIEFDDDAFISLLLGKTDDSNFTESEIKTAINGIRFITVNSGSDNDGVSLHPFTATITFRYDRKTIDNQGNVIAESLLKHAVISVPIRLMKDDLLQVISNTYKYAVYKYNDHAGTTFQGIVKADSSEDYTIEETGFYRVLLSYTDERTIATATEMLTVFMAKRTVSDDILLTSRADNTMPDAYIFPYSSSGVTDNMRGINGSPARIMTIPFKVAAGTKITLPSNLWRYMYIEFSDLNTLHSTYATGWLENEFITFNEDTIIALGFATSESSYTDEEIADTIANTKFTLEVGGANNYINVKTFGAVGDGTTDDTTSIQSALNNGGTIHFPAGTYKVTTHLILHSNTRLILDEGATILRAGEYNMMFISDCTDETLAYDGVKNIVIDGGTLDMGTGITQGGAVLGLIHCENVTLRNITCKHNNGTYHFFDICGCKDVLIDKCIFKDSLTTGVTAEFIQFDAAESRNAFPSPQLTAGANTFDRTIDQNIEVRGCTFELNNVSPAFGNHNSQPNKNINIHDNVITGQGGTRGAVAFNHPSRNDNVTTQVLIHHNIFEGCTYGFEFRADADAPGKIYVRDNIFKGIGTLKINPDSPVGEFLNNIELT